jgi:hypothetical protein
MIKINYVRIGLIYVDNDKHSAPSSASYSNVIAKPKRSLIKKTILGYNEVLTGLFIPKTYCSKKIVEKEAVSLDELEKYIEQNGRPEKFKYFEPWLKKRIIEEKGKVDEIVAAEKLQDDENKQEEANQNKRLQIAQSKLRVK